MKKTLYRFTALLLALMMTFSVMSFAAAEEAEAPAAQLSAEAEAPAAEPAPEKDPAPAKEPEPVKEEAPVQPSAGTEAPAEGPAAAEAPAGEPAAAEPEAPAEEPEAPAETEAPAEEPAAEAESPAAEDAEPDYPWVFDDDEDFAAWVTDGENAAYLKKLLKKTSSDEYKAFIARADAVLDSELKAVVGGVIAALSAPEAGTEAPADEAPVNEETAEEASEQLSEETPADGEIPADEETVPEEEEQPEEEPEFIPCTLTEGCLLADGHEGDCVLPEEEIAFGFAGMAEGYTLSAAQVEGKKAIAAHNMVGALAGMKEGRDYLKGQIYYGAGSRNEAEAIAAAYSAKLISYAYGIAVARLTTATVVQAMTVAADPLNNMPPVSPNYTVRLEPGAPTSRSGALKTNSGEAVPFKKTWQYFRDNLEFFDPFLQDPNSRDYQWQHDVVNTYEAWSVTKGEGVLVAVLDTGISAAHDEFSGRVYSAVSAFTQEDIEYNPNIYAETDLEAYDEVGHGTHVSGIIAADLDNGTGGAGVAPEASILSVKVLGSKGYGTNAIIARGLKIALQKDADVVNMSLGGSGYDWQIDEIVRSMNITGTLVVAAMGNDGENVMSYPAGYRDTIAVGAIDKNRRRASFSNWGSWCDVCAPGVDIHSTSIRDEGYEFMSGTSQATPVVTGVIALYISAHGRLSSSAMVRKLQSNGAKCASSGLGRIVDAEKLFAVDRSKPVVTVYNMDPDISGSSEITSFKTKVPTSAYFTIEEALDGTNGEMFIYTVNGKTPAIKNGKVSVGTVYTGPVPLDRYANKKVTVRAACVSGMGIKGAVQTKTFTVARHLPDTVTVLNAADRTNACVAGSKIAAGRSVALKAKISPADAVQSVTWKITSRAATAPKARVSSAGTVTTAATDSGRITVTAFSKADPEKCGEYEITILPEKPVARVRLSDAAMTVQNGETFSALRVLECLDDKGNRLPNDRMFTVTSSKPSVVSYVYAEDCYDEIELKANAPGTAKITVKALDGSGKSAVCTVTVVQKVAGVSNITGPLAVRTGKTATYKAVISPANASNKKVTWSIDWRTDNCAAVTISQKGVLTVPKTVKDNGRVQITARSQDDPDKLCSVYVDIEQAKTAPQIGYSDTWNGEFYGPVVPRRNSKTGQLTSLDIQALDTVTCQEDGETELITNKVLLGCLNYTEVDWSSSDSAVASVERTPEGSVIVTAHKAGTAVITCAAGAAKSTVKINAQIPASSLSLTVPFNTIHDDIYTIAVGRSAKHTPVFGDAYGKPAAKASDVSYTRKIYALDSPDPWNPDVEIHEIDDPLILSAVTVSKAGTLTVKSTSYINWFINSMYESGFYMFVEINAATGPSCTSRVSTRVTYNIVSPTSAVKAYGSGTEMGTVDRRGNTVTLTRGENWRDGIYAEAYLYIYSDYKHTSYQEAEYPEPEYINCNYPDFTVTTSNAEVATPTAYTKKDNQVAAYPIHYVGTKTIGGKEYNIYMLKIISGPKTGTAKITVKANDGTGRSCYFTVKVR